MKKIGVIGCGNISGIYLKNLQNVFTGTTVAAVADLNSARAEAAAREYHVPRVLTAPELLADPEIDIVLNLTTPGGHYTVCRQALEAGKHVHVEKPLSVAREEGAALTALAREKGLLLGGAPDTFMGAGIQTCRKLIDDGWIGRVIGATAFMTNHGHESWHPDPAFYYKKGGGPLFDMGPYYLTALVSLIGPVRSVTAEAKASFPTRTVTSAPRFGEVVEVETPTHYAGVLEFAGGATVTMVMSFDIWAARLPHIEIYGTRGSLSVPDPNTFGGPVSVRLAHHTEWREVPLTHRYGENSRGIAVADMAAALERGGRPRASGELAFHVLDTMHAFEESARKGRRVRVRSTAASPAPLDPDFVY